jgi:hypothetical protein
MHDNYSRAAELFAAANDRDPGPLAVFLDSIVTTEEFDIVSELLTASFPEKLSEETLRWYRSNIHLFAEKTIPTELEIFSLTAAKLHHSPIGRIIFFRYCEWGSYRPDRVAEIVETVLSKLQKKESLINLGKGKHMGIVSTLCMFTDLQPFTLRKFFFPGMSSGQKDNNYFLKATESVMEPQ